MRDSTDQEYTPALKQRAELLGAGAHLCGWGKGRAQSLSWELHLGCRIGQLIGVMMKGTERPKWPGCELRAGLSSEASGADFRVALAVTAPQCERMTSRPSEGQPGLEPARVEE